MSSLSLWNGPFTSILHSTIYLCLFCGEHGCVDYIWNPYVHIYLVVLSSETLVYISERDNSLTSMASFRTLDLTMTDRALLFLFFQLLVLLFEIVSGEILANVSSILPYFE